MPSPTPKTIITVNEIKDKKLRNQILTKASMAEEQARVAHQITNSKKTGTLDILKKELVDLLMSCGADGVDIGTSTQSLMFGKSVTISADRLRAALMAHRIDADVAAEIIEDSKSTSEYTTVTIKEK